MKSKCIETQESSLPCQERNPPLLVPGVEKKSKVKNVLHWHPWKVNTGRESMLYFKPCKILHTNTHVKTIASQAFIFDK